MKEKFEILMYECSSCGKKVASPDVDGRTKCPNCDEKYFVQGDRLSPEWLEKKESGKPPSKGATS